MWSLFVRVLAIFMAIRSGCAFSIGGARPIVQRTPVGGGSFAASSSLLVRRHLSESSSESSSYEFTKEEQVRADGYDSKSSLNATANGVTATATATATATSLPQVEEYTSYMLSDRQAEEATTVESTEGASEVAAGAAETEDTMPAEEPESTETEAASTSTTSSVSSTAEYLKFLLSLGAITSRGEFATKKQRESANRIITLLEEQNPTMSPSLSKEKMQGKWELLYTPTPNLFRSSPFFMAGRAVCETQDQADQYNFFCDMHRKALAISSIGAVRQIVSFEDNNSRIVSELEVRVGAIPFLSDFTPFSYSGGMPVTIDGAIVSSADIVGFADGLGWELLMDTVAIKGSNIPGLRQVLDARNGLFKLQSRQLGNFLENNLPNYSNPRPVFKTTYLDDQFRISRDQDDNAFMYVKTSEDPSPTDYTSVDSDLGIGRLLASFNDAVTKFYL